MWLATVYHSGIRPLECGEEVPNGRGAKLAQPAPFYPFRLVCKRVPSSRPSQRLKV